MAIDVEVRGRPFASTSGGLKATLPAEDYYAPDVFELERERVFFRHWLCVGREEAIPRPGDFVVRDVVGESVLVLRDRSDAIRAFYNVCRHRGSRLCDAPAGNLPGVIQCPYHAWTYSLEGALVGTPNVSPSDGLDRSKYPLHPVAVDTWDGFVFVNLSPEPAPLRDQLGEDATDFVRYRLGTLRVGHRVEQVVEANWKILVENYCECLHCPTVHPELVDLVPTFKRGVIVEDDGRAGNRLRKGATTWTRTGTSTVPPFPWLPEEDQSLYHGMAIFPNVLVDLLPDVVRTEVLWPLGPERTLAVREWLFDPDALARPDFDAADIIEFHDLVDRQDVAVCENAQRGVRSRAYRHGVYPPQDRFVYEFNERYRRARGALRG
ncbi:MAG: aromatic ring-hydroxylating oxygenase subunit alpha [Methanobacteriota archaeon]